MTSIFHWVGSRQFSGDQTIHLFQRSYLFGPREPRRAPIARRNQGRDTGRESPSSDAQLIDEGIHGAAPCLLVTATGAIAAKGVVPTAVGLHAGNIRPVHRRPRGAVSWPSWCRAIRSISSNPRPSRMPTSAAGGVLRPSPFGYGDRVPPTIPGKIQAGVFDS